MKPDPLFCSNEEGLHESGPGIFEATDSSGVPLITQPGSDGTGILLQGWLNGRQAWSQLLADDAVQGYLLVAIAAALIWLAVEVRQQRRTLAKILATMHAADPVANTEGRP